MINDYKSRSEFASLNNNRRHPRLGLAVLLATILCATAIYASMQGAEVQAEATASPPAAPRTVTQKNETPAPAEAEDPLQVTVALSLPGIASSSLLEETAAESVAVAAITTATPIISRLDNTPTESTYSSTSDDDATRATEAAALPEPQPIDDSGRWLTETVKPGDSLARIFRRLNLSSNLLHRITHSSTEAKDLANITPGEALKVKLDSQGELLELVHQKSPVLSLHILPEGDSFTSRIDERPLEKRVAHTSSTITSSLYQSAQASGLPDSLIMELANIFGWDIDFALEIRAGDQFSVIYEEEYLDGEKYRNGSILAAEFINRGEVFRAIRYEDKAGNGSFFSPEGNSMRKAFLRAPVDFRRISSRFTKSRFHPVLGKKRPHRGVDYSAATGTPIKAAGDGKVVFRGRKGGYGNTIIIKHANQYTTLYGHLSKFRSKVKSGSRVRQGQVIGYVGKTGLATGPHLHYEFRVNGVHRNPLTVKLPTSAPIAKKYRDEFLSQSKPLLTQLDRISTSQVLAEAKTQ